MATNCEISRKQGKPARRMPAGPAMSRTWRRRPIKQGKPVSRPAESAKIPGTGMRTGHFQQCHGQRCQSHGEAKEQQRRAPLAHEHCCHGCGSPDRQDQPFETGMPQHRKQRYVPQGKSTGRRIKKETGNCKIKDPIPRHPYKQKARDCQQEQVYRCKLRVFSIDHFIAL